MADRGAPEPKTGRTPLERAATVRTKNDPLARIRSAARGCLNRPRTARSEAASSGFLGRWPRRTHTHRGQWINPKDRSELNELIVRDAGSGCRPRPGRIAVPPQRHAVIVLGRHSAPLAAPAHLERYRRGDRFAAGERMSRRRPPPAKWLEAVNQAESPRQEYAGPMIRGDSATDIEHRLALALGEYLRLQGLAADMNDRSTCDVSPRIADPHGRRT